MMVDGIAAARASVARETETAPRRVATAVEMEIAPSMTTQ